MTFKNPAWQTVIDGLDLPDAMWIAGAAAEARDGQRLEVFSSARGSVIGTVPRGQHADVELAATAARASFEDGAWSRCPPDERAAVLLRLAVLIDENADELSVLESLDTGKLITDVREQDLPNAAATFRYYATALDKVYGEVVPTGSNELVYVTREALGVIGAIIPWNYPLETAAWKLAPALAAGNSVILKPAEQSPLTALRLGRLAQQAGLPDGVLNVVTGLGSEAGQAISSHPDVDAVVFTGSTATGRRIQRAAGESNMKSVHLECGGKSANIVFADADPGRAARAAANGMFVNAGQVCSAPSRLLVHEGIKDEVLAALLDRAREIVVGDPFDPCTTMGPLIDEAQTQRVLDFVDRASVVASLALGGERLTVGGSSCFVAPTVFDEVPAESELAMEEVFGPVLAVMSFSDESQAVSLANATRYGLAASLWTNDLSRAHRVASRLHAGTVSVNTLDALSLSAPFGGVRQSGAARDLSLHALESYTSLKTTWVAIA